MKIHKPKGLKGVNGKKPIAVPDIVPYLPKTDCFFDSRHWVCETTGGGITICLVYKVILQLPAIFEDL